MEKAKIAEEFLKSLENPQDTMDIMLDRIDPQTIEVINNYADLIAKIKLKQALRKKTLCRVLLLSAFF